MLRPFEPGALQEYHTEVTDAKLARFPAGEVHAVYSTFALAQDAEWACRLFVLPMLEPGEEGIGVSLTVEHVAPALPGRAVKIVAELLAIEGRRVDCKYQVWQDNRLIATGLTSQKIIQKAAFDALLSSLDSYQNNDKNI